MQADEAGDEDGVGELDCAAEAGGGVDPVGVMLEGFWGVEGGGERTFWEHVIGVLQCCDVQWLGVDEVEAKVGVELTRGTI